jgi:hypothetical protein
VLAVKSVTPTFIKQLRQALPTSTANFEEKATGVGQPSMTNKSSDRNEQRILNTNVRHNNKICSFDMPDEMGVKSPHSPDHHHGMQTIENKNSRSNIFYSGDSMSNS